MVYRKKLYNTKNRKCQKVESSIKRTKKDLQILYIMKILLLEGKNGNGKEMFSQLESLKEELEQTKIELNKIVEEKKL